MSQGSNAQSISSLWPEGRGRGMVLFQQPWSILWAPLPQLPLSPPLSLLEQFSTRQGEGLKLDMRRNFHLHRGKGSQEKSYRGEVRRALGCRNRAGPGDGTAASPSLVPATAQASMDPHLGLPELATASHLLAFLHVVPFAWNAFPSHLHEYLTLADSAEAPAPPGSLPCPSQVIIHITQPFRGHIVMSSPLQAEHLSLCM